MCWWKIFLRQSEEFFCCRFFCSNLLLPVSDVWIILKFFFLWLVGVVVAVKTVRSHLRSMNYYCNQTREQKGGEKSQIFRGRERKKRVEQLLFVYVRNIKMMSRNWCFFASLRCRFFHPTADNFFLSQFTWSIRRQQPPVHCIRF